MIATDVDGITALTGYWRVPNQPTPIFVKCLNPCACLGAKNPREVQGCFNQTIGAKDLPEGCSVADGYREGSRLCADCMNGYTRDGKGKCRSCHQEKSVTIFLFVLLALFIVLFLLFLIWATIIKRGGATRTSDGVKKIFLSYLQLTSLAMTMNIPWPQNYITMFRVQSSISSVGEAFLDARCALYEDSTPVTISEVEYMKTIAYAILPICLVICTLIGWKIYAHIFKIKVEEQRAMSVGSIVLLLYLIYPSITSRTLALWKCDEVEHVGNIFVIDPETLCDDKVHQMYQHTLGIGCILCYVVGLPSFGVVVLYKCRNKLDERRTRVRFGLLYDGFVREHYMHETWVVLRKFLLIVIGIFTDKLQVIFSLGVVGSLLVHTVWSQPFATKGLTRLEILLFLCSFLTLWIGGIFVVYPECNSRNNFTRSICSIGEVFVIILNIGCFIIGVAVYLYFIWSERKDMIKGVARKLFNRILKTFGSLPGENDEEVQWSINPLEEKTDIEETDASSAEIEILPIDITSTNNANNTKNKFNTIDVNKLVKENKLLKLRIEQCRKENGRKDEIIRKLKEG
jgi:hypothetical protein